MEICTTAIPRILQMTIIAVAIAAEMGVTRMRMKIPSFPIILLSSDLKHQCFQAYLFTNILVTMAIPVTMALSQITYLHSRQLKVLVVYHWQFSQHIFRQVQISCIQVLCLQSPPPQWCVAPPLASDWLAILWLTAASTPTPTVPQGFWLVRWWMQLKSQYR